MNVTVADCLRLPTLREAQLVAGAKGLDRAVSSVSVLEWPETNLLSDELIVGNELVISALVTIKDDVARQCCVLRHLRSMGAAGLVLFYVGVFIPQIDDALIAVADEINLPLIAMPFGRMDFRYSDMITDIVEYIHKRRMQGNYYTAEVMNSIALLEPQQRNINTALRLLSDRMRCTLLLTDRYLERRGAAAFPTNGTTRRFCRCCKSGRLYQRDSRQWNWKATVSNCGIYPFRQRPIEGCTCWRWTSLTKWILKGCSKQ